MATSAPAFAKAIAIARPMPELAPVTKAFCPASGFERTYEGS
jgi:hypothetical protein